MVSVRALRFDVVALLRLCVACAAHFASQALRRLGVACAAADMPVICLIGGPLMGWDEIAKSEGQIPTWMKEAEPPDHVLKDRKDNGRRQRHNDRRWAMGPSGLKALEFATKRSSVRSNLPATYGGCTEGQVWGAALLSDFECYDRRGEP